MVKGSLIHWNPVNKLEGFGVRYLHTLPLLLHWIKCLDTTRSLPYYVHFYGL